MDSKAFLKALEGFEPSDPGALLLRDAVVSTLKELARAEQALSRAPLTVTSERGTVRGHPLLDEVRKHRVTLARLVSQLFPNDAAAAALARRPRRSS